MNRPELAKALRDHAEKIRAKEDLCADDYDNFELSLVLARIIEGRSIETAFGAPGDWGYYTPIGAALAAASEQPSLPLEAAR